MNQWEEVKKLDVRFQEHVANLYKNFPLEARDVLATWIESQDWDAASIHEPLAVMLYSSLLAELEKQRSQQQSLLHRHMVKRINLEVQETYKDSPLSMASAIASFLKEERQIISMASAMQQGSQEMSMQSSLESEKHKHVDSRVAITRCTVQRLDQEIKGMEELQDDFDSRYKRFFSGDPAIGNMEFLTLEANNLQEIFNVLDSKRKEVLAEMAAVTGDIDVLMNSELAFELKIWKRRQQFACIGGPPPTKLDQLQNWFTLTAQNLFQIKRQLDKLREMVRNPVDQQIAELEERVMHLISHLIKSSFVVELQPCTSNLSQRPLVIKTTTHFSTKVRLLVKLPEADYQLRVRIALDKEPPGNRVCRQFTMSGNNTNMMDVDLSNGCLSAEFTGLVMFFPVSQNNTCNKDSVLARSAELRDQKSKGMRGHESFSVTEELHVINYQAQFCMHSLRLDLETISLPLVVISNTAQMPSAWASVMWYNMLIDEPKNLSFFSSPLSASWAQLSEVLSWQFSSFVGLGLNKEQLSMLENKLLDPQASNNNCQVTWAMFCKENLPGKTFTFWTWLESILDLIKKHLQPLWMDGCIMGFVTREREWTLLKGREVGTFLLRFSESQLGGITFTWVDQGKDGKAKLSSVVPSTKNSLGTLPFANIIRDYKLMVSLFPYHRIILMPVTVVPASRLTESPSLEIPALSPWSQDAISHPLEFQADLFGDNEMNLSCSE